MVGQDWVSVSQESFLINSFDNLGFQYIRLIVTDDNGAQSVATSVSIKIIEKRYLQQLLCYYLLKMAHITSRVTLVMTEQLFLCMVCE